MTEQADRQVSRRVAVLGGAAVAGGVLVTAAGCGSSGGSAGTSSTSAAGGASGSGGSAGTVLAPLAKVPAGGGLVLSDEKIVLTRDTAGAVHGFSAVCPHQGCLVGTVSQGSIECPCHGSVFDASTGAVHQGPATSGLTPVTVKVSGDNIVTG